MKRLSIILFLGLIAFGFQRCDTAPAPEVAYITVDTLLVNATGAQGTIVEHLHAKNPEHAGTRSVEG